APVREVWGSMGPVIHLRSVLMRPWLLAFLALALATPVSGQQAARDLFGAVEGPTTGPSIPVGGYSKGCLAGGMQLATDGTGWQAMRLSRDRRWGARELVNYIAALA